MIIGQQDYRQILRNALSTRCASNPNYSLRAFARDLGLSPTQLSLVLNEKKGISPSAARTMAQALGCSAREREYFCTLVESAHSRSQAARTVASAKLAQFQVSGSSQQIQLDAFRAISDWYHFAILQLVRTPSFREDSRWISGRLNIPVIEVQAALKRLIHLELLERKEGRLQVVTETVLAPDGMPSEAIRNFHRQILTKATQALAIQSIDQRYFNTTLRPLSLEDLPRAKTLIQELHQKFMNESSVNEPKADRIYCLSVQLFDLTNQGSTKEKPNELV